MGKLVKRAELTTLGTLAILLFTGTHLPAILSSLDNATGTPQGLEVYTAAAAAPYVADTVTAPSPVTMTTAPITPDAADPAAIASTTPDINPVAPDTSPSDSSATTATSSTETQ